MKVVNFPEIESVKKYLKLEEIDGEPTFSSEGWSSVELLWNLEQIKIMVLRGDFG